MADIINYNNFPKNYSYSDVFRVYQSDCYLYINSESWAVYTYSQARFLGDWHGTLRVYKYNGSGWTQVYSHYMQDTSANISGIITHNCSNYPGGESYAWSYRDTSKCNLWLVMWDWEKWGSANGAPSRLYFGSCGTASQSHYDSYLKNNKIYSNGRIGQTKLNQVAIKSSSSQSISSVLSTFASNRGTLITSAYSRCCRGEITT